MATVLAMVDIGMATPVGDGNIVRGQPLHPTDATADVPARLVDDERSTSITAASEPKHSSPLRPIHHSDLAAAKLVVCMGP